eukprot:gb/GECG01006734.1/.p1 GENE.gb/GECG01006734.1/~~gb/GECG01006734.1/.p1  ORF type:complete len:144 (+),score=14.16 gb/GECG01006734.1/:1-432(+)
MSTLLYTLFIVSKNGGMIYCRHFSPEAQPRSSNELLIVASTFHSLHAIAGQLSPRKGSKGISELEAHTFSLRCLETPTGVKMFATAKEGSNTKLVNEFLNKVYEYYSDFVLKNPFQDINNVIHCELFDQHVTNYAKTQGIAQL